MLVYASSSSTTLRRWAMPPASLAHDYFYVPVDFALAIFEFRATDIGMSRETRCTGARCRRQPFRELGGGPVVSIGYMMLLILLPIDGSIMMISVSVLLCAAFSNSPSTSSRKRRAIGSMTSIARPYRSAHFTAEVTHDDAYASGCLHALHSICTPYAEPPKAPYRCRRKRCLTPRTQLRLQRRARMDDVISRPINGFKLRWACGPVTVSSRYEALSGVSIRRYRSVDDQRSQH